MKLFIGYCRLCKSQLVLTEELEQCECGNLMAQIEPSGEPSAVGGNAVIIKMDADKIVDLCEEVEAFSNDTTLLIDPTFTMTFNNKQAVMETDY